MRFAVIEQGRVTNVIEAGADFHIEGALLVESAQAGIGWTWDGERLSPADAPEAPVPSVISDRQFAQALAIVDPPLISMDEALAWAARGDIPAPLLALVEQLPEPMAFAARMKLASAVEYHRSDPLVDYVAGQMQIPQAQVDALWRLAATL